MTTAKAFTHNDLTKADRALAAARWASGVASVSVCLLMAYLVQVAPEASLQWVAGLTMRAAAHILPLTSPLAQQLVDRGAGWLQATACPTELLASLSPFGDLLTKLL